MLTKHSKQSRTAFFYIMVPPLESCSSIYINKSLFLLRIAAAYKNRDVNFNDILYTRHELIKPPRKTNAMHHI